MAKEAQAAASTGPSSLTMDFPVTDAPAFAARVSVVVPPPELIFAVRWSLAPETGGVVGMNGGKVLLSFIGEPKSSQKFSVVWPRSVNVPPVRP